MPASPDQQSLFRVDSQGVAEFEKLSHENGIRYWYARDYMEALGYEDWPSFRKVLRQTMAACLLANIPTEAHFTLCERTVNGRKSEDYKLNRFACCMIALNCDPKKKIIAEAQVYFSSLAEWVDAAAFAAEGGDRILIRQEISEREVTLAKTAKRSGVVSFSDFQNAGYRGMYNMDIWELKCLRGMSESKRSMLDFMGKDELAGNLFRLSLTEGRLKRENIYGQLSAEYVAEEVGTGVRNMMIEQTGKAPENLPLADDIRLVKKGMKVASKELLTGDNVELQRIQRDQEFAETWASIPVDGCYPDCHECQTDSRTSHNGSSQCSSGSIASGGIVAHCTCDYCFSI